MPDPTQEQSAVVDEFQTGGDLVVQAGAGTGKTTTLQMLAEADSRNGLYIVFNKAAASEAKRRFPARVQCTTAHSLAYRSVGHRYRNRLSSPRIPSRKVAAALGIHQDLELGGKVLEPWNLAYVATETVRGFCLSADHELTERHVPVQRGAESPEVHVLLAEVVVPFARQAWADAIHPEGWKVKFLHDHYLKLWQLTQPQLNAPYVMLDEAQDTNPVLESVINGQRGNTQLVLVGDSAQQIYAWRGARDIMTGSPGRHLNLSQSFRFGTQLAHEANRWLSIVNAPLRLTGHHETRTSIGPVEQADAVLCRTNAGAMIEVRRHLGTGRRVAMAGGGDDLRKLALAARDLKSGKRTNHHDLLLFKSWGELQEYAENDPAGRDLLPWVELVDDLGHEEILGFLDRLGDEHSADVTISTAHKAKGREWPSVRIADDFPEPEPTDTGQPGPVSRSEARLAYVAITRARHHLERGSLAWIDDHPAGQNTDTPNTARPGHDDPWARLGPAPR
ncbi:MULTISPECIES: UvrD-helicase domain-containing protein [unclassified Kitasatospora]|uniref:UvrD-helicase domain-containing protein n=1 Tax=unclassified Kitasatospora TaxID=2633591 RepID=UPI0034097FA0